MFLATLYAGQLQMVSLPELRLPWASWQQLAAQINADPNISPVLPEELQRRYRAGQAQIATADDEIICYCSVKPIFTANERHAVENLLRGRVRRVQLPGVDVYESATGWTHPEWRGLGLGYTLRLHLYGNLNRQPSLIYSTTRSPSVPRLLYKLGLRVIAWDEVPFVSSFKGWFDADRRYTHVLGWHEALRPWNGPSLNPREHEHDWAGYHHFWVSDVDTAVMLDAAYEANVLDVSRWRGALAEVLGATESMQFPTPFVLPDNAFQD